MDYIKHERIEEEHKKKTKHILKKKAWIIENMNG
jgi:hypothetical protein